MVSDEIIKVLNELGNKFGIAVNWTSENVLPYAQELIQRIANYRLATGIMWLVTAIIMTILAVIFAKKFKQYWGKLDTELGVGFLLLIIIITAIAIAGFCIALSDIPEAIFLPEVSAIKYINGLI